MARALPRKLNFACGLDHRDGYVNMDVVRLPGVDIVWDFENIPYPFPDGHFTEIYACHALEHTQDLARIMTEFHRILAPGGKVQVLVPYFSSPNAYRDPTHRTWFTAATFSYFSPGHAYGTPPYRVLRRRITFFSSDGFMRSRWYSWPFDLLLNAILPVYERFFPYWLPASEIHFLLEVVKEKPSRKHLNTARRKSSITER